jgi:hypothetical protein
MGGGVLQVSKSAGWRASEIAEAYYYDFNISSHEKFVEKLRYIQRNTGSPAHELCALGWNPVRRGLVVKPEEWK